MAKDYCNPPTPNNVHGTQLKSVDQVAHQALADMHDTREDSNKYVYRYTLPGITQPGSEAIQRIKSRGLNKGGGNYSHRDMLGNT